jgi:cbb3-type cytochrome oxidase maturation protein
MSAGARLFLFWAGIAAIIGVAFLVWAWRSGQFRNVEEAKYRMLDDREPEPWPDRDTEDRVTKEEGDDDNPRR